MKKHAFGYWFSMLVGVALAVSTLPAIGSGWSDNFVGGAQQTWIVEDHGDNSTHVFLNDRYELHTESDPPGAEKSLVAYVNATTGDGIMQARVKRMAEADNFLAYLLARANISTMSGYVCGVSSSGDHLWFGKLTGGVYESITSTGTVPAFDPADFQVRFAVYGNTLAAKVWTTGTAEPTDWQITATDSDYTSGVSGVMLATYPTLNWDTVQVAFDDVSLSGIGQDTVWVNNDWVGSDPGAEVEPGKIFGHNAFATIQAAIAAAEAGDTIEVAAGTYVEQLTIETADLTIKPMDENGDPVIVKLPDTGLEGKEGVDGAKNRAWILRVSEVADVNIQGLTVDGGEAGFPTDTAAYVHERDPHLEAPVGIWYDNASGTIEGNTITNIYRSIGYLNNEESTCYSIAIKINDVDAESLIKDNTVHLHERGRQGVSLARIVLGTTVTLEGNTVYGVGDDMVHNWMHSGIAVANYAGSVVLTNNVLQDLRSVKNNSQGIYIVSHGENGISGNAVVTHNTISGTHVATYIYALATIAGDVELTHNTIADSAVGIYVVHYPAPITGELTIANNSIADSTWGIYTWASSTDGADNATVSDNDFANNQTQVGDASEDLNLEDVLANNTFDRAVVVRGSAIKVPVIFSSIQDAIDAADANDTIDVAAGEYYEEINIDKALTLRGATWDQDKNGYTVPEGYAWDPAVETVLMHPDPSGGYNAIVDIYDVDGVTFEGFVVQELNAEANKNSSLVRVRAQTKNITVDIKNNVIGPNTKYGDQDGTQGRMGLNLVNNPYSDAYGIINSDISGNKIFGAEGNGNNIFIWSSYKSYGAAGPASMAGTIIQGNEIYGANRNGIETAGGVADLEIRDNLIYDNKRLNSSLTPLLKYGNGIMMIRGSSDKADNEGYGPVNVTIANNDIYGNDGMGIYMGPNNKDITITNNRIENNGWDGVMVDLHGHYWNPMFETEPDPENQHANYGGSENVVANDNIIAGNTENGVRVNGEPTNAFAFDATSNYWGKASGPYHPSLNPAGTGDAVSDNVDFDPWYIDYAMTTTPIHEEYNAETTISTDTTVSGNLTINANTTVAEGCTLTVLGSVTVNQDTTIQGGGAMNVGKLVVSSGASVTGTDATLTIDGASIYGTFTMTDSINTLIITDDYDVYSEGDSTWDNLSVIASNTTKNIKIVAGAGSTLAILNGTTISKAENGLPYYFIVDKDATYSIDSDVTMTGGIPYPANAPMLQSFEHLNLGQLPSVINELSVEGDVHVVTSPVMVGARSLQLGLPDSSSSCEVGISAADGAADLKNIWALVFTLPAFGDTDSFADIDEEVAFAFGIDTDGIVRAFSGDDWVTLVHTPIPSNTWVGFAINADYTESRWDLYMAASGVHGDFMERIGESLMFNDEYQGPGHMRELLVVTDLQSWIDEVAMQVSPHVVDGSANAAHSNLVVSWRSEGAYEALPPIAYVPADRTFLSGSRLGEDLKSGLANDDEVRVYDVKGSPPGFITYTLSIDGEWGGTAYYPEIDLSQGIQFAKVGMGNYAIIPFGEFAGEADLETTVDDGWNLLAWPASKPAATAPESAQWGFGNMSGANPPPAVNDRLLIIEDGRGYSFYWNGTAWRTWPSGAIPTYLLEPGQTIWYRRQEAGEAVWTP